ncbi:MAG: outer membrane protein [Sulfurimonas sp.]|jgi:outer membrane protein|uniref:MipA/OmpV family protein n=1 Tax=Sulfurimonas sp. TaxID=2022749 RepID=UPI0039E44FA9
MKYILSLLLLLNILFAQEKQTITLGLGSYVQTQPYTNVDSIVLPSPVIFFDNGLFYARWTRIGVYFLGEKNDDFSWGFSLTAQPRPFGYESSDIAGMNERKDTWEGGLAFSAKTGDTYIEILALGDLLGRYDSWIVKTELGHDFTLGDFSFYPSVTAVYQSRDFLDYYYGVTQAEATSRGEHSYRPGSGIQYGVQTYIKYPFTKQLSALVNLRADKLPSQATSSTIINDEYIYSGLASLIYTFDY